MTAIQKANNLLQTCPVATIASIDERGYPRTIPMAILKGDSIYEIWFATNVASRKVAHYKANNKSSVSFFLGHDAVSLNGTMECINDTATKREKWVDWLIDFYPDGPDSENYSLMKFTPVDGVFMLDGKFERITL